MRRCDKVGRAKQDVFLGRFFCEHIEGSRSNMARFQPLSDGGLVNQPAACAIHQDDAWLGFGQRLGRQDVAGLVGQWGVQRNRIGAG